MREQFNSSCFNNKAEVIKRVINTIESFGVYVTQIGGQSGNIVDYEEFDGAAIYFEVLPIILLNADKKADTKLLFTIFHELVHLLLKNKAITNYYFQSNDNRVPNDIRKIETYCNKVAAAALLPKNELIELFDGSNISDIANDYRVSKAVVTIRLNNLNLIDQDTCNRLLESYENDYRRKIQDGDRGPNPNTIKKRNLGNLYINAIREGIANNYLNYYEALKSLGMKDKAAKKALYDR